MESHKVVRKLSILESKNNHVLVYIHEDPLIMLLLSTALQVAVITPIDDQHSNLPNAQDVSSSSPSYETLRILELCYVINFDLDFKKI